ncbi:hypothetical protein [Paludibaculum fermentans]|uniref:hypothetical protein n=1 Tax=Paludibaculum fermentans TaxID=1473598 RepID=UPI003EBADBDB
MRRKLDNHQSRFEPADVKEFNYRLSQFYRRKSGFLARLPDEVDPVVETLGPSNPEDIWSQRWSRQWMETQVLGHPYAWFTLTDLARYLLQPVEELGRGHARRMMDQLGVFTVVRLSKSTQIRSLDRPDGVSAEEDVAGFAAALSQIEECNHPLPAAGTPGVACELLNEGHIVAASTMGCAQVMCDQGIEYDRARLGDRRDKWFPCYAAAVLTRAALHGWKEQAAHIAEGLELASHHPHSSHTTPKPSKPNHEKTSETDRIALREALEHLRHAVLRGRLAGFYEEISQRDALNRFFRLCLKGLRVPESEEVLRRTIAELETGASAQQRTRDGGILAETQSKVEWIEVFVVSIYSLELVHIVGNAFEFREIYVACGALLAMGLAIAAALSLLKPWKHHPGQLKRLSYVLLSGIGVLSLYLLLGFIGFPKHGASPVQVAREEFTHMEQQVTAKHDWSSAANRPLVEESWRLVSLARDEEAHNPKEALELLKRATRLLRQIESKPAAQADVSHTSPIQTPTPISPAGKAPAMKPVGGPRKAHTIQAPPK